MNSILRSTLLVIGILGTTWLHAQNVPRDTLPLDSIVSLKDVNRGPKNALLWAIIPGGGQVYNKSWWKVPLVYGGLLGVVAYADFNQTQYSRFVNALEARCLGDGNVIEVPFAECVPKQSEFPESTPTQSIITARNNANRARQTAYIGILAAYVLQAVEAYTDAHLREFDISEDLSFRLQPVVVPGEAMGMGVVVPLGSRRGYRREVAKLSKLTR